MVLPSQEDLRDLRFWLKSFLRIWLLDVACLNVLWDKLFCFLAEDAVRDHIVEGGSLTSAKELGVTWLRECAIL